MKHPGQISVGTSLTSGSNFGRRQQPGTYTGVSRDAGHKGAAKSVPTQSAPSRPPDARGGPRSRPPGRTSTSTNRHSVQHHSPRDKTYAKLHGAPSKSDLEAGPRRAIRLMRFCFPTPSWRTAKACPGQTRCACLRGWTQTSPCSWTSGSSSTGQRAPP